MTHDGHQPLIRRTLLRRILKGLAVALGFAFLGALGFFAWALESGRAAEAVRQDILQELRDRCQVEAEFSSLTLDPLHREVQLFDLKMRQQEGGAPLLAVEQAHVALKLLPLFYGRYQLERVALLGPQATIRWAEGRIQSLPPCVQPEDDADVAPLALGISELSVERGRFDLLVADTFAAELSAIDVRLAPAPSGGMDLVVGVEGGRITRGARTLPLQRFRVLGHVEGPLVRPRALSLERVELSLGQVEAQAQGAIDLLGPVYEGKVQASLPMAALQDFLPDLPEAKGQAQVEVSVVGTAVRPRAVGRVVVEGGRLGDYSLGDRVAVELAATPEEVQLSKIELRLGTGGLVAEGRLGLQEGLPLELRAETDHLSLARVLDAIGITGAWADLTATGKATASGRLSPLALGGDFQLQVEDLRVYDRAWDRPEVVGRRWAEVPARARMLRVPEVRVRGAWGVDPKALEFTQATLVAGATAGTCDARIGIAERSLHIEAQLPSFDWVDLGPVAGLSFGGYGALSAVIDGPMSGIGGLGTFELEDITVAGIPFGRGTGSVDWHDVVALDVTSIEGRLGESRYDGAVSVRLEGDVPLSISGQVRSGRLEDALVPFRVDGRDWGDPTGRLFARFELLGPVDRLTGPLTVDLEALSVLGERAEKARVEGRMEQGRIVVDAVELTKHGARVSAYGFLDPNKGDLRLVARTRQARLQDLDVVKESLPNLDGGLDARISLGGSLHGVTGTVSVRLTDVQAGTVSLGSGRIAGPVEGAIARLRGAVGTVKVESSELSLQAGLPYKATLFFDNTPAVDAAAGLAGHQDYSGAVTLRAELHGGLAAWPRTSGALLLERARFTTGDVTLETAGPAKLELTEGVLSTKRLVVAGPKTRLTLEGAVGARRLDLRVAGKVDLGLLELTSPTVEKAGGVLTLDAALGGSPSDVNLVGTGRVEGGLFQLRGFENRATGFTGDLIFSQSSVLIERAEGRWAGGKLAVSGSLQLERFLPKSLALRLDVSGARPRFSFSTLDMTGTVSGRLTWSGAWARSQIAGALSVERGLVNPKLDWQSMVGSRRVAEAYDPSAEVMDFDLLFKADEPIRVKNDEADLEVLGEVRLTGTNERFGMLGAVSVVRGGRVVFLGREYAMESGVVEFRDRYRFKTRYDLVLSARACDARISLNLVGSFDEVQTVYTSYPEMDQRDIVSCLVRGVKVSDLDQDLASFAGSALLKLSGVDREVKKVLPIDQLDVTTEYSSLSRQYEPRVMMAKDLSILDRPTRLEYSTSLLRSNDQRAALRMRLTPRLSLQFGWTSSEDVPYGDWGLDLKRRWEW
jgi:hypothetical protein